MDLIVLVPEFTYLLLFLGFFCDHRAQVPGFEKSYMNVIDEA